MINVILLKWRELNLYKMMIETLEFSFVIKKINLRNNERGTWKKVF